MPVHLILLVVAVILFVISAFPVPSRFNTIAAGLAFFAASFLV